MTTQDAGLVIAWIGLLGSVVYVFHLLYYTYETVKRIERLLRDDEETP